MPRQHSSPADFELVGLDRDPTPGDPDLIQGIVQRYRDIAAHVFRTDQDGAITVESDGYSLEVRTFTGQRVFVR